jgi:hypothetical protein
MLKFLNIFITYHSGLIRNFFRTEETIQIYKRIVFGKKSKGANPSPCICTTFISLLEVMFTDIFNTIFHKRKIGKKITNK